MSLQNFLKSISTVFNSKVEEKTDKIITSNPEAFLDEAIKQEKIRLNENRNKLGQIKTLVTTNETNKQKLIEKLETIQALISKYQREGNLEAVKAGNDKYKLRYSELEVIESTIIKLKEAYESVKAIVVDQQSKIDTYEAKKSSLVGQLKAAQSQEEAMNLINDLNLDSDSTKTFNRTEKIINDRIGKINGQLDTQKDLSKDDFFKGL